MLWSLLLSFSSWVGWVYMNAGRVIYFDILNVVAAFGVVAMHFNGLVHAYMPTWDWVQAHAVDCLFYWAVPVFFMLSGSTLMDYRDRYTTKESERLVRLPLYYGLAQEDLEKVIRLVYDFFAYEGEPVHR